MRKTLLHNSGREVKYFHNIAGSFDGHYFEKYILPVEILFFNSLSNDFYQCLLDDLKLEYCNAPEFVPGTEYEAGMIVIYDGQLWCADEKTCEPPACGWTKKGKFTTDCYNELWECFLGEILTGLVIKRATVGLTIKLSPKGLAKMSGDNYAIVDTKELSLWLKTFDENLEALRQAMMIHIRQDKGTCFDKLKECLPCVPENCDPCDGVPVSHIPNYLSIVGGYDKYR